MPTAKITTFDAKKLPSPLQLKSWREDWAASGGTWQTPTINNNTATYSVTGRTVPQVENVSSLQSTHTMIPTLVTIPFRL